MTRLLLATISFLSLAACTVDAVTDGGDDGGGDDGGDGGDDGGDMGGDRGGNKLTVPEYMSALARKKCDDAFTCMATFPSDSPIAFSSVYGETAAVCYARAAAYHDPAAVAASIAAGRIAFDGVAAATCVAGFGEPACGTHWTSGPAFPAACDAALAGKVADGESCEIDFDCANRRSSCDAGTKRCVRRLKADER